MRIKKNDEVIVIAGKDKGKRGKVIQTLPKTQRVLVEGVNMITKHQKPNMKNNTGGIIKKEAPLHVSNVMYYDKETNSASRIRYELNEENKKYRVSVKSGNNID